MGSAWRVLNATLTPIKSPCGEPKGDPGGLLPANWGSVWRRHARGILEHAKAALLGARLTAYLAFNSLVLAFVAAIVAFIRIMQRLSVCSPLVMCAVF